MHRLPYVFISIVFITMMINSAWATNYYVNSKIGNDSFPGTSPKQPFRSLQRVNAIPMHAGDCILFAAGQVFAGELRVENFHGLPDRPIRIDSYLAEAGVAKGNFGSNFQINARSQANGILVQNSSYITIKHATIEADGNDEAQGATGNMRVGVKITASPGSTCRNIHLDSLELKNIYFENKGFVRSADEVKTANGVQRYGWGIRLIADQPTAQITEVDISNCRISDVSHTGIKMTGSGKNITWVRIYNNNISYTGGPGIQMSEVKNVHVYRNSVDHSGSNNDSRKWGRGSGLWTWGSSLVLIENNSFTNANGPGDSAGAHIDFNCNQVVLQYNFSANNAGGFCEILGNNYNCAYRFNVSVNDGRRNKGENGAFQEGKTFWLSGYQGNDKPRKGPVNSYFYNNTIYVDSSMVSRVAIDATSKGILIANNIFCVMGSSKMVLGDQNKADDGSSILSGPVMFKNNLWFSTKSWPADAPIKDTAPRMGDPKFKLIGKPGPENYVPGNAALIKGKGIKIEPLSGDLVGLPQGLNPEKDFYGNPIGKNPPIGAIAPR